MPTHISVRVPAKNKAALLAIARRLDTNLSALVNEGIVSVILSCNGTPSQLTAQPRHDPAPIVPVTMQRFNPVHDRRQNSIVAAAQSVADHRPAEYARKTDELNARRQPEPTPQPQTGGLVTKLG